MAYVMAGVAGGYLGVAGVGAGLLSGERGRWRGWFVGAVVVGFVGEVWWRLSWAGPERGAVVLVSDTAGLGQ